jgi:hypothetical protein
MAPSKKTSQRTGIAPVAASRQGHDYQDLYGWFRALDLLRPTRHVTRVSIEDPSAQSFDDVTITRTPGTAKAHEFIQVKFHVDQAGAYSTDSLMTTKSRNNRNSLLEKAWLTWRALRDETPNLEIVLVSTYSWLPTDPIAKHIRSINAALDRAFVEGSLAGQELAARTMWMDHLGKPDEEEFQRFLLSLRFRLGFVVTSDLLKWTSDVMGAVGLKDEEEDARRGELQIHDWINEGRSVITADDMREAIERLDLRQPGASPDPAISLYLHTIIKEPQETAADWDLDWREHFEEGPSGRGHAAIDPSLWNDVMLPELARTRDEILAATTTRLLRIAGKARLSIWFAAGWTFQRPAGWTLEIDQNGTWWRNDTAAATDIDLVTAQEVRGGEPDAIAVGVSVMNDLSGDVRNYLEAAGDPARKLLLVQLSSGIGPVMRDAGDAVRLADRLREVIRAAAAGTPKRVLLFYSGPLAGAAFIGARLNAVAPEIQIFEHTVGSYSPSFTLTQK